MTTVLLMLGALVVVFGVTALATRESSALAPAPADRADVVLPEGASADDVRAVRFGLALRGYRMRDVDEVLERLAGELAARDSRIAVLEGRKPEVPESVGDLPAGDEPTGPAGPGAETPELDRAEPDPVAPDLDADPADVAPRR